MPELSEYDSNDKRRSGRLRCESLSCNLGTIVNLSGSGARVRKRFGSRPRQEDTIAIRITSRLGQLSLRGRVVWVRPHGAFGFEAGIHFLEVNSMAKSLLCDIAREHHDRRILGRAA